MGGDGDSNHLVSGGDLEGDSNFTQPSDPAVPRGGVRGETSW